MLGWILAPALAMAILTRNLWIVATVLAVTIASGEVRRRQRHARNTTADL